MDADFQVIASGGGGSGGGGSSSSGGSRGTIGSQPDWSVTATSAVPGGGGGDGGGGVDLLHGAPSGGTGGGGGSGRAGGGGFGRGGGAAMAAATAGPVERPHVVVYTAGRSLRQEDPSAAALPAIVTIEELDLMRSRPGRSGRRSAV